MLVRARMQRLDLLIPKKGPTTTSYSPLRFFGYVTCTTTKLLLPEWKGSCVGARICSMPHFLYIPIPFHNIITSLGANNYNASTIQHLSLRFFSHFGVMVGKRAMDKNQSERIRKISPFHVETLIKHCAEMLVVRTTQSDWRLRRGTFCSN